MAKPSDLVGEIVEVAEARAPLDAELSPTDINSARQKRASERRTEAMALRLAGFNFTQIGERLGISREGAQNLLSRTMERVDNKAAEQMRALENARLDRVQAAIWSEVLSGDLKAVNTFLQLSARRARMNGLDAPTAITLSVNVRQEMEQALSALEQTVLGEVVSRVGPGDDT